MKTKQLYFTTLVLIATTLVSCIRDDWHTPDSSGQVTVTLTLQLPGGATPQPAAAGSRAMPGDETQIDEIQVLLFQPADDRLVGHYPARNITTTGPDSRSFQVDVIEGTFDIVILANSKDIVDQAGLAEDMSRREVTKRLTFTQDGKIPHNSNTLIPFWGELKSAVIVNKGELGEVYIYRAWAKIDVILYTDAVKNDFKLRTVTLHHWQKEMALLPAHYDETKEKVTAATDTGNGLMPASTQITYSGTEIDNEEKIENKIYLNETPNPGPAHFPEIPCLILGGEYKGETTYYRVDFFTDTGEEDIYHDLLRNHQYELRIVDIRSSGSPSGPEAYNNIPTGLETEIIGWNEGDMKNIIIDGEYWLRVDPAEFTLAREARQPNEPTRAELYSPDDYSFEIESNTHWTIDPATITYSPDGQANWLSFNQMNGTPGTPARMELYVTENNSTGPRTATFTVAAGTIRFPVTVTQTDQQMTWIKLLDMDGNEINEIDIISRLEESEKVEFVVEWYPHDWNCEVSVATGAGADGPVEYESGDISGGTLTGGHKHFELQLKKYQESDIRTTITGGHPYRATDISFTVESVTKTLSLTNRVAHLVHAPQTFRLDYPGAQLAFYTNLPFHIASVNDPHNILTPAGKTALENYQFSSPDLFAGRNFNVDLDLAESTAAKDGKEVHVTFTFPPQYNIPDRTIAFEAYHLQPNSYIVKPGGSIHIPIRKAFRAWSQYPMNSRLPDGTLGCEVLWEDMDDLITDITLTPAHTQDKIDSEIFVRTKPDKTQGNAVVALTVDGTVVWSWHLWVIDYDPEENTYTYVNGGTTEFMRYDLGALDNDPNAIYDSEGFYYQWGRKDPFPPTEDINNPQSMPFTDHHWVNSFPGSISSFSTAPRLNWSNSQEAWKYTITNPLTYITTQAEPHNWDYANNSLWTLFDGSQKTYKTEFDPCPEGWRVPQTQQPWGNETQFFNPLPSQNNFGYIRVDGYYMPATGYIDNEGNYTHIGQEAATYTAWITNQGQGNYTSYLSVSFVPGNNSYGYTSGRKSSALNVRCSRPK